MCLWRAGGRTRSGKIRGLTSPSMRLQRALLAVLVLAVVASACANEAEETGPDLEIERRIGFSVIVDQRADGISIGFSQDRNAAAGEEFDVTGALWRVEAGPWNEPPVTCLGRGQRVELGISQVENAERPGLLKERVVWLSCLAPPDS